MKHNLSRFWYKFKNWFRTKPGSGEPPTFLSGAEAELRTVTTWMCQADNRIFLDRASITVYFSASTPFSKGISNLRAVKKGNALNPPVEPVSDEWEYIIRWAKIISKCNRFIGTEWKRLYGEITSLELPVRGVPSFFNIYEVSIVLEVTVSSPSAHERYQALLSLSEWLDGKVSEQEKRRMLQLPQTTA